MLSPRSLDAKFRLSICYVRQERYDDAIRLLRELIANPKIEVAAKAGSKTEIAVAAITVLVNGRPLDADGKDLTRRFANPKPGQITVESFW